MSVITAMGYAIVSATVDGLVELTAELAKRGRGGAKFIGCPGISDAGGISRITRKCLGNQDLLIADCERVNGRRDTARGRLKQACRMSSRRLKY